MDERDEFPSESTDQIDPITERNDFNNASNKLKKELIIDVISKMAR